MIILSALAAAIVTAKLLQATRPPEELAGKLYRQNFFMRAACVAGALGESESYADAADMLKSMGWFSEVDTSKLADLLESECDDLAATAATNGFEISAMLKAKPETGQNPVQPTDGEGDIPI